MTNRTRFAPSPTGFLHIGGARTALYAWLYAKKYKGQFILRIEDTDTERSTPESVQAILEGMAWLGLDYDEGPFYQSQRLAVYLSAAEALVSAGKAYRCYCSKERLEALRAEQMRQKQKPRYDGHCRELKETSADKPHVIRFKNPDRGEVHFCDLIHGDITVQNEELDDLVVIRTDGVPTYNFAVVIDDSELKITHVIRGDDHINNTPRQINLLTALQAKIPLYAHLPMILGSDGKRLSKRHGAVSVLQYRDDGYLPEALLNYLVRLGWGHGNQEVFSKEEMIALFSLEAVHKSPAAFNPEKLMWLNQHYLKTLSENILTPHLNWHLSRANFALKEGPKVMPLFEAQKERVKTLVEWVDKSRIFFEDIKEYAKEPYQKFINAETSPILETLLSRFELMNDWHQSALHSVVIAAGETHQVKLGQVAQPLRVALTGNIISPPIDVTLELMGKEKTLKRIRAVLKQ